MHLVFPMADIHVLITLRFCSSISSTYRAYICKVSFLHTGGSNDGHGFRFRSLQMISLFAHVYEVTVLKPAESALFQVSKATMKGICGKSSVIVFTSFPAIWSSHMHLWMQIASGSL